MKLRNGDQVLLLSGKDKGKKGSIEKVLRAQNQVLISGVNIYKKHVKKQGNTPGGIIEISKPVNISKVVLVCPKCNLNTKVKLIERNDKKVRTCKKCKQEV